MTDKMREFEIVYVDSQISNTKQTTTVVSSSEEVAVRILREDLGDIEIHSVVDKGRW